MELCHSRCFVFSISTFFAVSKHLYCAVAYSVNLIKAHSKHQSLEAVTLLRQEGAFFAPFQTKSLFDLRPPAVITSCWWSCRRRACVNICPDFPNVHKVKDLIHKENKCGDSDLFTPKIGPINTFSSLLFKFLMRFIHIKVRVANPEKSQKFEFLWMRVCLWSENKLSGWRTPRTCPWCWWGTSVTSRPGQSTPSRLRT